MVAPLQDSSLCAGRSGQRLAAVPRRASRIKGIRSRPAVGCSARCACSTTASTPCRSLPHRPQGPSSPGSLLPARPSVPRIHTKINIILYHFYPWTTYISFVYQTYILIVLSQKTKVSPFLTSSSIIFFTCLNETGVKSLFP